MNPTVPAETARREVVRGQTGKMIQDDSNQGERETRQKAFAWRID